MASNASAAGFRGPAKRAAFGDVTNVSRPGTRDGAKKVHKAQSVLHLNQARTQAGVNKENVGLGKDHRYSQKPQNTVKPAAWEVLGAKPSKNEQPAARVTSVDQRPLSSAQVEALQPSQSLRQATAEFKGTLELQSRQPRHFKSQPQLQRQQQPSLRRTQSRQFDRNAAETVESLSADDTIDLVAVPSSELSEVPSGEFAAPEPVDLRSHYDSIIEEVVEEEAHSDHPQMSDVLAEQAVAIPVNFRDSITQGLSEPEEYWDEDEEDYDDQDQAYTTAHSIRSRDMTTGGVTVVLQPRVTARVQHELDDAALDVARTRPREDIIEEAWDVSMVAEYGDEIFSYLREMEVCHRYLGSCRNSANLFFFFASRSKCFRIPTIWISKPKSSGLCGLCSWSGLSKSTVALPSSPKLSS